MHDFSNYSWSSWYNSRWRDFFFFFRIVSETWQSFSFSWISLCLSFFFFLKFLTHCRYWHDEVFSSRYWLGFWALLFVSEGFVIVALMEQKVLCAHVLSSIVIFHCCLFDCFFCCSAEHVITIHLFLTMVFNLDQC